MCYLVLNDTAPGLIASAVLWNFLDFFQAAGLL
jgi:hypothetical protein